MRKLLILIFYAAVSVAAQQSIRTVDWKNFSYPVPEDEGVPGEVRWMPKDAKTQTVHLANGRSRSLAKSEEDQAPLVTFDSVHYGSLTGIQSTVAAIVLTYHTGGTASWQYVYLYSLKSGEPQYQSIGSRQSIVEISTEWT